MTIYCKNNTLYAENQPGAEPLEVETSRQGDRVWWCRHYWWVEPPTSDGLIPFWRNRSWGEMSQDEQRRASRGHLLGGGGTRLS